jgi:hypothetical protein
MSATEATAEIFVTAFKALKRKEREAVLQKLVADAELADDLADRLALEAVRHQSHGPLRDVLRGFEFACELASRASLATLSSTPGVARRKPQAGPPSHSRPLSAARSPCYDWSCEHAR